MCKKVQSSGILAKSQPWRRDKGKVICLFCYHPTDADTPPSQHKFIWRTIISNENAHILPAAHRNIWKKSVAISYLGIPPIQSIQTFQNYLFCLSVIFWGLCKPENIVFLFFWLKRDSAQFWFCWLGKCFCGIHLISSLNQTYVAIKQALKGCHAEGIYILESYRTAGNAKSDIVQMFEVTFHFPLIATTGRGGLGKEKGSMLGQT